MHVTVLRMLSTNSLSAFSSATTTSAASGSKPVRLVREISPIQGAGNTAKNAVPNAMPAIAPPRGSLLNLSV